MRRAGAAFALAAVGCNAPVSNAIFYQEAAFLAALPSEERLGVPAVFLEAELGDDPVLAGTVAAAFELDEHVSPLIACGETLRTTLATERTESHRAWDNVPVVIEDEGEEAQSRWMRAEIVRPESGTWSEWSLELAASRIGPWYVLATGRHEDSGAGSIELNLDSSAEVFGTTLPGRLDVSYEPDQGYREVEIERAATLDAVGVEDVWGLHGDRAMSWLGELAITQDGETWTAGVVATQTALGGRGGGLLWPLEGEIGFDDCWDAHGDRVWVEGSEGIAAEGSEAACAVQEEER